MNPYRINYGDIGRTLEVSTRTKSKPIRGTITAVEHRGGVTRVTLVTAYGTKGYTLTENDDVELCP